MMTVKRKETIKRIIESEIDNLEDNLNSDIRKILESTLDNVGTGDIMIARGVFFKG